MYFIMNRGVLADQGHLSYSWMNSGVLNCCSNLNGVRKVCYKIRQIVDDCCGGWFCLRKENGLVMMKLDETKIKIAQCVKKLLIKRVQGARCGVRSVECV